MMTKLHSGQRELDSADDDDDDADQSNPYMSPSQATQKRLCYYPHAGYDSRGLFLS